MNIVVAIKHVPNLADELELNSDGTNLDFDEVDFVLNEWDEQALEQAVLIKEAGVAVSPGIGFGEGGDNHVRFALVENEHRIRQAVKGIKKVLTK